MLLREKKFISGKYTPFEGLSKIMLAQKEAGYIAISYMVFSYNHCTIRIEF